MTIWTNADLAPETLESLRRELGTHSLISQPAAGPSYLAAGGRFPDCVNADVAFGQPGVEDLMESTSLKWIHITSAGYTRYERDDLRDHLQKQGAAFTNSSSVYADPCAQQVLAFMLAQARQLPASLEFQQKSEWGYDTLRPVMRVLTGAKVLLVGYGAIAQRLTELLQPFGCEIRGLRRFVSGQESVTTYPTSEIGNHLPWAEHVVNILPLNDATKLLFGTEEFAAMQPGTQFYNIGRGDTVDQTALVQALTSGHLAHAYLDVVSPEPLPADHPLWSAHNCHITPHVGGGRQNEQQVLLTHFVSNLRRFETGRPLSDRVY